MRFSSSWEGVSGDVSWDGCLGRSGMAPGVSTRWTHILDGPQRAVRLDDRLPIHLGVTHGVGTEIGIEGRL